MIFKLPIHIIKLYFQKVPKVSYWTDSVSLVDTKKIDVTLNSLKESLKTNFKHSDLNSNSLKHQNTTTHLVESDENCMYTNPLQTKNIFKVKLTPYFQTFLQYQRRLILILKTTH